MEPTTRRSFQPAGAGGVLLGILLAAIALGALIGWAVGSAGIGGLVGAALVLLLAQPVFLLAGWSLAGWALGALLWTALEAIEVVLARFRRRTGNVAASAVLAFGL